MNKVDAKLGMKVESTVNHDYEYKIVKIKPTGCTVAVVTEGSEKGNIFHEGSEFR